MNRCVYVCTIPTLKWHRIEFFDWHYPRPLVFACFSSCLCDCCEFACFFSFWLQKKTSLRRFLRGNYRWTMARCANLRRTNAHHATKYMPPNLQFGKYVDSWPQLEMAWYVVVLFDRACFAAALLSSPGGWCSVDRCRPPVCRRYAIGAHRQGVAMIDCRRPVGPLTSIA